MQSRQALKQPVFLILFLLCSALPSFAQYTGGYTPPSSPTPTPTPDYGTPVRLPAVTDEPIAPATPQPFDASFQFCNWAGAVQVGTDPFGAPIYKVTCCGRLGNNCTNIEFTGAGYGPPAISSSLCGVLGNVTVATACVLDPVNGNYCANLDADFFGSCKLNGQCSIDDHGVTVSCSTSLFSGALLCTAKVDSSGYSIAVTITPPIAFNGQPIGSCTIGTSGDWPTVPPIQLPSFGQTECYDINTGRLVPCGIGFSIPF